MHMGCRDERAGGRDVKSIKKKHKCVNIQIHDCM